MRSLLVFTAILSLSIVASADDEPVPATDSPTESGEMKPVTVPDETIDEWRKRVCAADAQGYHPVAIDCPFSDQMKIKADGPYVLKRLPKRISELLQTQVSAALNMCGDPVNVFYGSISRYRGAAWYATRRGILLMVKQVHKNRMTDYMNPKINWPDWPADEPQCDK